MRKIIKGCNVMLIYCELIDGDIIIQSYYTITSDAYAE